MRFDCIIQYGLPIECHDLPILTRILRCQNCAKAAHCDDKSVGKNLRDGHQTGICRRRNRLESCLRLTINNPFLANHEAYLIIARHVQKRFVGEGRHDFPCLASVGALNHQASLTHSRPVIIGIAQTVKRIMCRALIKRGRIGGCRSGNPQS